MTKKGIKQMAYRHPVGAMRLVCGAFFLALLGVCGYMGAERTHVQSVVSLPVTRVELEGEAYFQVTKDGSCPFRVESVTQTVEVLGTQFNVYAYGDEQQVYTTLVEGKVTVTSLVSGKQFGLSPGEQAVTKLHNGDISIHKVNVDQVIGWKNGMFVFDDQNLETILRKVERWYNIEIFYKNNAAKAKVFKGNLPRYGELQELLRVLESGSQVRFSLKGRSLTVE